MTEPARVTKVVAYITRGSDLLVFRHRDVPLDVTGIQVPAGTVRPGEELDAAVLREAGEETGLDGLRLASYLGTSEYDARPAKPEIHDRHFFHLIAPANCAETWTWQEAHDGTALPTVFELYWLPLDEADALAAGLGALLAQVPPAGP